MKILLPVVLALGLVACAGNQPVNPIPVGEPLEFAIAATPSGGNADPTPFDTAHLERDYQFRNAVDLPNGKLSFNIEFSGQTDERYRAFFCVLPDEDDLHQGDVISWDETTLLRPYGFGLNEYLSEDTLHDHPVRSWGGAGSVTVASKSGRVVVLQLDTALAGSGEGTGSAHLEGTITIDFARQPDVDLSGF